MVNGLLISPIRNTFPTVYLHLPDPPEPGNQLFSMLFVSRCTVQRPGWEKSRKAAMRSCPVRLASVMPKWYSNLRQVGSAATGASTVPVKKQTANSLMQNMKSVMWRRESPLRPKRVWSPVLSKKKPEWISTGLPALFYWLRAVLIPF